MAILKGKDLLKNLPGGPGKVAQSVAGSDFLKSRAETAGRIAEFKLVDTGAKTMGVGLVPVYVVNWPAEGLARGKDMVSKGSKVLDKAGDIATGAAAAGALQKLNATRMVLEKMKTWGGAAWRGAGGLIMKHTPLFLPRQVLIPAAVGYGAGWMLNQGAGVAAGWATGGKYRGTGWLGEMIYDARRREGVIKKDLPVMKPVEMKTDVAQLFKQNTGVTTGGRNHGPDWFGDLIHDSRNRDEAMQKAISGMKPPEVKNDIVINLRMDPFGRIFGETGSLNTNFQLNLDRGNFGY
jgi:hypothetical protein